MGDTPAWPTDSPTRKLLSIGMGGPVGRVMIDKGDFLARSVAGTHRKRELTLLRRWFNDPDKPGKEDQT